jgi:hypothetical protein
MGGSQGQGHVAGTWGFGLLVVRARVDRGALHCGGVIMGTGHAPSRRRAYA